jgi:internalin A
MTKTCSSLIAVVICIFLHTAPSNAADSRKTLKISEQNVKVLKDIGSRSDLEVLSISCIENLQSLPDSIGKLTGLKALTVAEGHGNGCSMNPLLPESLGNLRALEELILYGAQDPRGPGHMNAEHHKFPSTMTQLTSLTYLDLGGNGYTEIPTFVKDLPRLKVLGFEYNELKEVPAFLSNLQALTTLKLFGNDLSDLPDFLNTLPKLTHISLGQNCKITQHETKMKELKKRFPKVTFDFTEEYDCPAE